MTRGHKPGWLPWKTWWPGDTPLASPCCDVAYGMRTFVWWACRPVVWSASVAHASASISDILHGAPIGYGVVTTPQNLSNPVDAAVLTFVVGAHQQLSQQPQAEHLHARQHQHDG